MRHRWAGLLVVAVMATMSTWPASAQDKTLPPVESLLPAETIAAVVVRDVTTLRTEAEGHPLYRVWKDPDVVAATAPFREAMAQQDLSMQVQARTGRPFEQVLDIVKTQFAIAIVPPAADAPPAAEGAPPASAPWVMLADIGEDKDLAANTLTAMLNHAQQTAPEGVKYSERLDDFNGLAIHVRVTTVDGKATDGAAWATIGSWLVMAEPVDLLKKTVGRVLQLEEGKTLLQTSGYKQTTLRAGKFDALAYADLSQIGKLGATAGGGMLGPVLNALGADTLEAGYLALNIEENHTDLDSGVFYTQPKGLIKMLAFSTSLAEKPDTIPADVTQVTTAAFSFQKMWAAAKETAGAIDPSFATMLDTFVKQIDAEAGVDFEKSILDELGERFTYATRPHSAGSLTAVDNVLMIPIKGNPDVFGAAFDNIMFRALGQKSFEMRKVHEQAINTAKVPGVTLTGKLVEHNFSYVITKTHLILSLGSDKLLEEVLAGPKSPSVWQRDDVKAAMIDLTPGSAVGYTHPGVAFIDTLQSLGQSGGMPVLNPNAPLTLRTFEKYLGPIVSTWSVQATGQHGKTRMIHK